MTSNNFWRCDIVPDGNRHGTLEATDNLVVAGAIKHVQLPEGTTIR